MFFSAMTGDYFATFCIDVSVLRMREPHSTLSEVSIQRNARNERNRRNATNGTDATTDEASGRSFDT